MAHKIKGGAVYIGATKMKMACQYFERYWKAGQREMLEKLYSQARTVIDESMKDFNFFLNTNN
ncbi:Hpt domain-containing protein [Legionella yabuuchiae]|uniref:Hpt domain-containing protein n=1 Tax=Legionella yabuuchiae TaxID=376727 RepID=UPI0030FEB1BB